MILFTAQNKHIDYLCLLFHLSVLVSSAGFWELHISGGEVVASKGWVLIYSHGNLASLSPYLSCSFFRDLFSLGSKKSFYFGNCYSDRASTT